jgi:hypothetical protein
LSLLRLCGVRRIVPEDLEPPVARSNRARPPVAVPIQRPPAAILVDRPDRVVRERAGIADLVLEDAHGVAVPDGQPLARSDPEEAGAVAVQRGDRLRRQPALAAEPLDDELLGKRRGGGRADASRAPATAARRRVVRTVVTPVRLPPHRLVRSPPRGQRTRNALHHPMGKYTDARGKLVG